MFLCCTKSTSKKRNQGTQMPRVSFMFTVCKTHVNTFAGAKRIAELFQSVHQSDRYICFEPITITHPSRQHKKKPEIIIPGREEFQIKCTFELDDEDNDEAEIEFEIEKILDPDRDAIGIIGREYIPEGKMTDKGYLIV